MRHARTLAAALLAALGLAGALVTSAAGASLAVQQDLTVLKTTNPALLVVNTHRFDVYNSINNASGLALDKSGLTHGAPISDNAAGYLETPIFPAPSLIGATVVYTGSGTTTGAVTLVDWKQSIKSMAGPPGGQPAQGSFHVTFLPTSVRVGVYETAIHRVRLVTNIALAHPLPTDGTSETPISVSRTGDSLMVSAGSNPTVTVTDPEFAQQTGPWACWELYEQHPGQTPARITSIWSN